MSYSPQALGNLSKQAATIFVSWCFEPSQPTGIISGLTVSYHIYSVFANTIKKTNFSWSSDDDYVDMGNVHTRNCPPDTDRQAFPPSSCARTPFPSL